MPKAKPVTINGHRYDSMSAADRELGLPKGTIDSRLRKAIASLDYGTVQAD
jgi:hypothetical protein